MAEAAFRPTGKSVTEFLTQLEDPQKRADSRVLVEIMTRVTGKKPKMWHPGIVGFGEFHYTYGSCVFAAQDRVFDLPRRPRGHRAAR
jgi:hypothetical protein